MQDRAYRRWKQRVKKYRRFRVLKAHSRSHWWMEKWWKWTTNPMVREPGHWTHMYMIRPMRIRSNQMLRKVMLGKDPEAMQWPEGKKPHIYYW